MNTEMKKSNRLLIQTAGLFNCPYEWCILDFVYWKSNTQRDRRWICRMKPIQETTPLRRIETITDALDRLCGRQIGFSKVPFGKPQRRKSGKGREHVEEKQSYQYVFDAKIFDAWLKSKPARPIRKRIDPYPKTDSQLSESGQVSYPKSDTKRMNKDEEKKEIKETDFGSQPDFNRVAPDVEKIDLGEQFEKIFNAL
jgi:hypothetical protein